MKKIIILLLLSFSVLAQSHFDEIKEFQTAYKEEFKKGINSPIKEEDIPFIKFYEPNEQYKVKADFVKTKKRKIFRLITSNAKSREYLTYGEIFFELNKKSCRLTVYRAFIGPNILADALFLPFKDLTNGHETYGGGRYLDLDMRLVVNNKVSLDFNKSYNPYCAFTAGYSCPVPPRSNYLNIEVMAGEQMFSKEKHIEY